MRILLPFAILLTAAPAFAEGPAPCGDRANCVELKRTPAGENTAGEALNVIEIGLDGETNYDEPSRPCKTREVWLDAGKSLTHLATLCNDGYGARGVGEDILKVSNGKLELNRGGGSAWGWWQTWVVDLGAIPMVSETSMGGYYTLNEANDMGTRWDFSTFEGQTSWSAPTCGDEKVITGQFAAIPLVEISGEYDWKNAPLGQCALDVDGTLDKSTRGAGVVHGDSSSRTDAHLKVVATAPDTLIIEVADDVFHESAKSWVKRDHIELWTGPNQSYMDHCLEPQKPQQWGILLDGTVERAFGKPKTSPKVEVVRGAKFVRMRVMFKKAPPMVTVVYSDTDDGKSQEALLASSDLRFGDSTSLGRLHRVDPRDAVCAVKPGKLEPVRKPPETPVVRAW